MVNKEKVIKLGLLASVSL